MNIVLYGEETFLLNHKLEALKKKYHISEEDMNLMTYWCDETDMKDIIEDALTPPFLSEYKMIIIKNPYFLTTQKNKDSKDIAEQLLDYLKIDNPTTIFVIYHDKKDFDERKKAVKSLRKMTQFVQVDKLDQQALFKMTHQAIVSRGCEIDSESLNLFLSLMPQDLLEISKEVEKLCLYSKHIDKETIRLLVPRRMEDDVFELTKALLDKNTGLCIRIYKDLVMNNAEPIQLIALIAASLRSLYQVKLLDRKGYNDQEIASYLSMNPYRLRYIRQDGRAFELNELLEKINELALLDVSIKTGKIDRFKGLELFLIKIGGNE